jgi:hypothetical protein
MLLQNKNEKKKKMVLISLQARSLQVVLSREALKQIPDEMRT